MRLLVGLLTACAVTTAAAQQRVPTPAADQTLDRIVAIVGTRPILASQIEEEMVQQQAQGQTLPTDSAGLATMRRQILTAWSSWKSWSSRRSATPRSR